MKAAYAPPRIDTRLIALALLGLGASVTALVRPLPADDRPELLELLRHQRHGQLPAGARRAAMRPSPESRSPPAAPSGPRPCCCWRSGACARPSSELAGRVAGYIFVLATVGLAVVFYFGYASFFVLGAACPLCMTMYVSVAGIFLVSAAAATSLTAIPARLGEDVTGLTQQSERDDAGRRLARRVDRADRAVSAPGGVRRRHHRRSRRDPRRRVEALSPEQTRRVGARTSTRRRRCRSRRCCPPAPTKVWFIKFNDYQCPACRQTWALYRDVIAKYEKEYPGVFVFETRDLPLEPECGLALQSHDGLRGGGSRSHGARRRTRVARWRPGCSPTSRSR